MSSQNLEQIPPALHVHFPPQHMGLCAPPQAGPTGNGVSPVPPGVPASVAQTGHTGGVQKPVEICARREPFPTLLIFRFNDYSFWRNV